MEAELFSRIAELLEKGEPCVLVTQVAVEGPAPREAGARMLVFPDGHIEGTIGGGALEHRAIQEAGRLLSQGGRTHLATYELVDLGMLCGGRATLFYEVLAPKVTLAVFGAGHVGSTLARLAREATPFKVELYDDREERCREELAPGLVARHLPGFETLPELPARCYVVVCTDSHATDFKVVERILRGDSPPPFLGMLGSRVKAQEVKRRLTALGIPEERVERLRSPVGLPIGGKSPGEIAISILSELLAFHHGRLNEVKERLGEGG
ncbi:TPA: xanthine dehydrogenase accessory protein XdhC [Candidatus Acetothermia bacterium]|nr:xanthine dehydrogenase accessory protein XdhC [Candidatus Acetothermia bacterium]